MSEEKINIRLIEAVEKFPIIYDYTLPGHSNKDDLDKAWHEVSKEANLNVGTCKEKWRSVRNCWARHLRNIPASGSAAKTRKPYYLADYLIFLTPFTKLRSQSGNFEFSQMIEDPSSPSDELSIKEEAPIHEEEEIDHQNGESNVGSEVMPPPPPSCSKKQAKTRKTADVFDQTFETYSGESKKKKCPENELDNPDLLFLRSLLPEMSKLTPAQKSHFKISILQHLNSLLYSSSSSVSCPPSEFYCSSASSYVQNMNAAHSSSSSIASTPHPSPSDGNVYENSDPNFINIPRQFS